MPLTTKEACVEVIDALTNPIEHVWPDTGEEGFYNACYTPSANPTEMLVVVDANKLLPMLRAALMALVLVSSCVGPSTPPHTPCVIGSCWVDSLPKCGCRKYESGDCQCSISDQTGVLPTR